MDEYKQLSPIKLYIIILKEKKKIKLVQKRQNFNKNQILKNNILSH